MDRYCINLADTVASVRPDEVDVPAVFDTLLEESEFPCIERIYFGSYFCEQLFLNTTVHACAPLINFCHIWQMSLTLVVPVFGQSTLTEGKNNLRALLAAYGDVIDEITVNDFGMTAWLTEMNAACAINWGRLLTKDLRDPRYKGTSEGIRQCCVTPKDALFWQGRFPFQLFEADPFAPHITFDEASDSLPDAALDDPHPTQNDDAWSALAPRPRYALHLPHCFQSNGRICEVRDAHAPLSRRYRPAPENAEKPAGCPCPCLESYALSRIPAQETETSTEVYFAKQGRTVYFENPACLVHGTPPARLIWSPGDFLAQTRSAAQQVRLPAEKSMLPPEENMPPAGGNAMSMEEDAVSAEANVALSEENVMPPRKDSIPAVGNETPIGEGMTPTDGDTLTAEGSMSWA